MQRTHQKICLLLLVSLLSLSLISPAAIAVAEKTLITLGSGATYAGEIAFMNVPHGEGKATWPDGSTYSGSFFNGMLHGKGIFHYSNGDTYDGNFVYGFRSGKGKMAFSNGDSYNGEWQADMMHGKGKYTFDNSDPSRPTKDDTYDGQWRYNMMHGRGEYKFARGEITSGYWVKNTYRGTKLTATLKAEIGELDR